MVHGGRRLGFALLVALLVTLPVAVACAAQNRVSLKPSTGSPTTRFAVHFRSPDRTGTVGSQHRTDVLTASGPKPAPRGCVSRVSLRLAPVPKGRRATVTLNPARLGGGWCPGRFTGRITERVTMLCASQRTCPPAPAGRTVARFSFRVKRGGGPPAAGPTFAGLKLAITCLGGTTHNAKGERSYRLSWDPATEPATSSSAIVYDVFYAATPGGEDFSHPTVTTPPGATEFSIGVTKAGGAYFVVRARDPAGHEDQNTVEHQAVSNCG
jgi:hypothetical protein